MTLAHEAFKRLCSYGKEETVAPGSILFRQGDAGLDLFVVLKGRLEMFETKRDGFVHVVHAVAEGAFTGELDLFNSRRSLLSCRATRRSDVLRISRERLQVLLQSEGDLAEAIVFACLGRREELMRAGHGGAVVIGSARCSDTLRVRDFFVRSRNPHRFVDVSLNEDAAALVHLLECSNADLPAVFLAGQGLLRNPSNRELAEPLGLAGKTVPRRECDLAIIGAGPAGLAAAVYAASEGLHTVVLERHATGGQAGTSSRIENYLGFPTGISGQQLAANAEIQAQRFGAELLITHAAGRICHCGERIDVELGDGAVIQAKAALVATGARYRRLDLEMSSDCAEKVAVHYAATPLEALHCAGEVVIVVGGGNSAGQAALFLSRHASHVHLVVRRDTLSETMSNYLIQRLSSNPNVTLHCGAAISRIEASGENTIAVIVRASDRRQSQCVTRNIFTMIGAAPNTEWLEGTLALDAAGFIVTGNTSDGIRSTYATSLPGVFAVGDVRSGSVKRVASAAGEGAAVISEIHRYLAEACAVSMTAA
ncbi:thioredoxin reductase (NADPH) [Bryocella elongata]|uniref:Thioredoxin reductase (NADPH) n=1 Tax=Bryocella elongata TaxID=863522 RepID=A0A1H5VU76_9BACT|nr:cyclic nucleotide-binding domain-containing thioredoxin-disulfide reductase [Bryocella elongata]SEF90518.1 thioredoxin reductase (NADPH) [Bryocella elongata]